MIILKIDQAQDLTTNHFDVTMVASRIGMHHHNVVVLIINLESIGVVNKG